MEGPRYMTQFLVAVERDVRERCKRGGVNEKEMWEMWERGLAVYAVNLKGASLVREIDVVILQPLDKKLGMCHTSVLK